MKPNPELQRAVRDSSCENCRMSSQTTTQADVCVTGFGDVPSRYAIVTKFPLSTKARERLAGMLEDAGLSREGCLWLSALKCRVWDFDPNKTDQKSCKPYLHQEIDLAKPSFILPMGNEALFATLGKSGIMKYRSKTFDLGDARVMPTVALSAVDRNPGQMGGFLADLKMFANMVKGTNTSVQDRPEIDYVLDVAGLRRVIDAAKRAVGVSFDIESRSKSKSWLESHSSSKIVSLALTFWFENGTEEIYALPLSHPQSPFFKTWKSVLRQLAPHLARIPKGVAHNGKYDQRWLSHNGVRIALTFDTMLAAHLLDENRPKGLKPLAHVELGVPDWGIDTKDLWSEDLMEILKYNADDTWNAYGLYKKFRKQLLKDQRLARLFKHLIIPASNEFVGIESRGIWCDRDRLNERWLEAEAKLKAINDEIATFLPDGEWSDQKLEDFGWSESHINFNASNFLRWFLFDFLKMPVLARGKPKDDGSPGDPSVAESVISKLAEMPGAGGSVAKLLLSRVEWQKFCSSFFAAYAETIDDDDRIHTTFKVAGTTTGRLSSGKEDDTDKVSAKSQIRGVNLQQVPRNSFIRGLFGAAPEYTFIEADYSQVELRIAAYIARERNLLHLYQTGQDVHMAMAMRMTGKPANLVTKEERKKAKAVNFGFLYGMGWMKFIETAWNNYGVVVSEFESQAFRTSFFDQFPQLPAWHRSQKNLAHKFKRVQSPLGRIRHLPDIDSPVNAIKAEAERQAINSPVQATASDLTLLSMVMLQRSFRDRGLDCHSIGTVHDAINFECRTGDLVSTLPLIKDTMENLPTKRLFGVEIDVPLVADIKVGQYWGDARELTEDEVYAYAG